mmetsp:Transcript_14062/g.38575  ORF Transcript_14062/g.38575 Transcript_14062/m.38575 type:complete len:573 (+) Transcript_14062:306-2024(+)
MRHVPVGELGHKVGLHHAELHAKVGLVDAERHGGGGGEAVANHEHRDGHGIVREVGEVVPAQVRERDRLEEDHVTLEHAKVDLVPVVVRGDVHAVVREGGGHHEEVGVDLLADGEERGGGGDVVETGVPLELPHPLGPEDDVPRHEPPEEAAGADGGEEEVPGGGVVPGGEGTDNAAEGTEALGVDDVVELHGDPPVLVLGGKVGDDVNLAVVVKAHGVAVAEAAASALHGEQGLDLDVLVHGEHDAVHVAPGPHAPRSVAVLGVEHGVRVVVVVAGRHVNLVHGRDGLHVVQVGPEPVVEHAHHGVARHAVGEGILHLALELLVPPVRGARAVGVGGGDEIVHGFARRRVRLVREFAPDDVVVRDDPLGEGCLHVDEGVDAQREEEVGVLEEEREEGGGGGLVRGLEGLLAGDDVRELLADVREAHELKRVVGLEHGSDVHRDGGEAGHHRGGGDPELEVAERHEQRGHVRADRDLEVLLGHRGVVEQENERGDDTNGGSHHVQRDVEGVGVVRPEAHRQIPIGRIGAHLTTFSQNLGRRSTIRSVKEGARGCSEEARVAARGVSTRGVRR